MDIYCPAVCRLLDVNWEDLLLGEVLNGQSTQNTNNNNNNRKKNMEEYTSIL
jgi:hypothetical protein